MKAPFEGVAAVTSSRATNGIDPTFTCIRPLGKTHNHRSRGDNEEGAPHLYRVVSSKLGKKVPIQGQSLTGKSFDAQI